MESKFKDKWDGTRMWILYCLTPKKLSDKASQKERTEMSYTEYLIKRKHGL